MIPEQVVNCCKMAVCLALMSAMVLFFIWMERRRCTEQLRHAMRWYNQGDKRLGCREVVYILGYAKLKITYLVRYERKLIEKMQLEYKFGMDHK